MILFDDRIDAGRRLAERLAYLHGRADVIVLGIPRGGVVVAAEVARALTAPLDIFIARKIGAPFNSELAVGAVTSDGTVFLDNELIEQLRIPHRLVEREKDAQLREIQRRLNLYRGAKPPPDLAGKIVILVDDGVATGSTVIAALCALAKQHPARRILAVPVAPAQVAASLLHECDELVVLDTPEPFQAVGRFYINFEQTTDEQVEEILGTSKYY